MPISCGTNGNFRPIVKCLKWSHSPTKKSEKPGSSSILWIQDVFKVGCPGFISSTFPCHGHRARDGQGPLPVWSSQRGDRRGEGGVQNFAAKVPKEKNTHLYCITVSINISTAALTNHQHVMEEWSCHVRLCLAVNIAAVVQVESFRKTRELQPCDGHCKSALMQAPPVAPRSSGDVSRSQSDTVLACLRRCRTGPHPDNIWQWWYLQTLQCHEVS